jgi:hypothetical protein
VGFLEPHGRGRCPFRLAELSAAPPVIVVHALAHAAAALSAAAEAGRLVTLASAPDAGVYGGPGWFREMIAAARTAIPGAECSALLDCGSDAGAAQAAISAGVEAIVFTGRADVAARLTDIAGQAGARLRTERPAPALDLGDSFFATPETLRQRCIALLAAD